MTEQISKIIQTHINLQKSILESATLVRAIEQTCESIIECYKNGGKVLFCGNGGSAADAQHLAAELSGRFYFDRPPLYAEALHTNTSYLTAVANDYSYDVIYSRLVDGMGKSGDIIIGLSTSGNSKNIVKAFQKAKDKRMKRVALTGKSGGELKDNCEILINIPSDDTPRIQEAHIMIGHIICEFVEKALFNEYKK